MSILVIDRATLAISGTVATFTPDTGLGTSPSHLAVSTVVVNTVASPAPAEVFEPTATKRQYYRISIERFS